MANKFPNPDGRNKIEFTEEMWTNAEKMASIQCTGEEIAGVLGIDYDTLLTNIKALGFSSFSDWFKKYSAGGKMSLRRRQFKMSETNPTMAIWLGKQYLGQKDHQDLSVDMKPQKTFDTSKMSKQEYLDFLKKQIEEKIEKE
jgi:hypothetical protein